MLAMALAPGLGPATILGLTPAPTLILTECRFLRKSMLLLVRPLLPILMLVPVLVLVLVHVIVVKK